ncbi:MAG TPA: hypothetical protein DCE71_01855 [Parachlamydiales bacterium]|nr:hypothetical protein [Parachlamydiales bacterium]
MGKCFFCAIASFFVFGFLQTAEAGPKELKRDLLQEMLASSQIVVIDVYADWCGPCRRFEPIFKQASEHFSQQYHFFKLNGDKERELARYFNVTAYPTTLYFKEGREIARHTGCMSMSEFTSQLDGLSKRI